MTMSAQYILVDGHKLWYDDSIFRPLRPDETYYRPGDMRPEPSFNDEHLAWHPIPSYAIDEPIAEQSRGHVIRLISPYDRMPRRTPTRNFLILFFASLAFWFILAKAIDWFFMMQR